ncbi:hypothetical protein PHACT_13880 [Pseudohongiella acticola]|jgi:hypothetical protein|uniref:Uncharacterized protein n=1 Tax=Pseudohongiella acticola TaxID=1524254 RepID=A0A1E8CGR0_9GAMM|nr:hypothetical protein [Pseudohongiella acticola]OFE11613.1 hypothetical protein PHACT_13880 [Pseudohongiella acticola]
MNFKLKRHTLTLCFGMFISALLSINAVAQDLNGRWQGSLVSAQYDPITIVFNFQQADSDTTPTGTLDIPSQFRTGLPIDSIRIRDQQITVSMRSIQAEYYGTLVLADNGDVVAIEGDWNQSGEYVPLRLEAATDPQ